MEAHESASQEPVRGNWPRYDAAALGFRNYWYPVLFARDLGRRPVSITLLGERLVLFREGEKVYALQDRCPHRGVPLSMGRREWPGLITCAYHGWCYDLASGDLVAALTDGPDSPICGKATVRVPTYPVAERATLLWVYVGALPAPPVEADVPAELLQPGRVIDGRIRLERGNWRHAVENGMDEGHARYLHRTALWTLIRRMPAWTRFRTVPGEGDDAAYLVRIREYTEWQDTYPRIGRWPNGPVWKYKMGGSTEVAGRLPGMVRNRQVGGGVNFEFYVPVDADHYRRVLLVSKLTGGLGALLFRLWYRAYAYRVYHGGFNDQDQAMIEAMQVPPERLYRPDASITAWRKWCHDHARRLPDDRSDAVEGAVAVLAAHRAAPGEAGPQG